MKNRLNITIEENLIEQAKRFAARNNKSLSELVEDYFKEMVSKAKPKHQTLLQYMNSLPHPKRHVPEGNRRKDFYEGRKKKYGF